MHHELLPAGDAAPEWVHLLPAGAFRGVDGRGPYRITDAQAIITASMASGKVPLDENHATEIAKTAGIPSPARGWIVAMQTRPDGIWGQVEWNKTGTALLAERAYRGISPVFRHSPPPALHVERILNVALTNSPNISALTTLHSEQDTEFMDQTKLLAALGLQAGASEADVLGAIGKLTSTVAAHSELVTKAATAAGVKATDADGLLTALMAQHTAAAGADDMKKSLIAMQTELSTLKSTAARAAAIAAVDGAINAGKPIRPLRDHFIARHMVDPTAVETEMAGLPSINDGGLDSRHMQQDGGGDELTQAEKDAADKMGVKHEDMKAQKKRDKENAR